MQIEGLEIDKARRFEKRQLVMLHIILGQNKSEVLRSCGKKNQFTRINDGIFMRKIIDVVRILILISKRY